MSEQTKAWAVVGQSGAYHMIKTDMGKQQIVAAFISEIGLPTWTQAKDLGYYCIPVTITPTKETP